MDIIKAKKLFAPPDKPDATKLHLILKVNQGFESLAMELCDLIPKSEKLDSFVQELHKVRLQIVFDIEHTKTGKAPAAPAETGPVPPAKPAKTGGKKAAVETKAPVTPAAPVIPQAPATPENDNFDNSEFSNEDDENNNDNDDEEGFA